MRPKLVDNMAVSIDVLDRVLAQVGKRVAPSSEQTGTITVQTCSQSVLHRVRAVKGGVAGATGAISAT
jgi:hypothetical protein